jgi:hypothetical protein
MPLHASVTREDCGHDDCFPSCGSEEVEVAGEVTWIQWKQEWDVRILSDVRLSLRELIAANEALIDAAQAQGVRGE